MTVAGVCYGMSSLCRHLPVEVEGERVQIRARVRSLKRGSLKLEFVIKALEQATNNPDIRAIAVGIASSAIVELFKMLIGRTSIAKNAKAKELAELIKTPEVATALRETLSALQRDPVVTEIEVSTSSDSVKLSREQIARADQELAEWASDLSREDSPLWIKHAQIKEIIGIGPNQEWKIWWDDGSTNGVTALVRAPTIPSGETWKPRPNKRIVVDLRVRYRPGHPRRVESAEILNVHWREMRDD
jgi:hypothetical protein